MCIFDRFQTIPYNPRMRNIPLAWFAICLGALLASGFGASTARAAQSELYFSDDFSGGEGRKYFYEGVLDQRNFAYADGQYEIDTSRGSSYGQSVLVEDLDTYRLEVTGQLAQSSDSTGGGFGLSFNYREPQKVFITATGDVYHSAGCPNLGESRIEISRSEAEQKGLKPCSKCGGGSSDFLLFLVYDRGAYTVLRYLGGQTTVLLTPTKTKLFAPGSAVTLTVDAAKGQLRFFINGAEVGSLREDRLISGGMGMFATAKSVARFDDFRIYAARPPEEQGSSDDFAGDKVLYEGSWGEVNYGYDSGRYVIDTSQTQYIGLSPFPEPALNFELAVDVELLSGDPVGGFGMYLRDWPNDDGGFNQFRLLVSGDWFAVEQSADDRPLALAQWTQHGAVHRSSVNRLKVRADGGELTFFVNGEEVYHCTDASPHSGAYGFFASAGLRVAFDNVSFAPLP